MTHTCTVHSLFLLQMCSLQDLLRTELLTETRSDL